MRLRLRIVGNPACGEALRAVLLGDLNSSMITMNNKIRKKISDGNPPDFYLEYVWKYSHTDDDRGQSSLPVEGSKGPIYIVNRNHAGFKINAEVNVYFRDNETGEEIFITTIKSETSDDKIVQQDIEHTKDMNKTIFRNKSRSRKVVTGEDHELQRKDERETIPTSLTLGWERKSEPPTLNIDDKEVISTNMQSKEDMRVRGEELLIHASVKDGYYDFDNEVEANNGDEDVMYVDVLRKLKAYARLRIRHINHFYRIMKFLCFFALYCTMLYRQTDPFVSYEVSSSIKEILHPKIQSTQNVHYLYEWLSQSVVDHIWIESRCGDGVCQAPYEFPSFGRFGCKADCGPAQNLLQILVHIQTRFSNSQAVSALDLMGQVKWNLCLKDPGRETNDLPDLCWYEKYQKFTEANTNSLLKFDAVAGNWYIHVLGDHLGLVSGKIYRIDEESGDLILTPTVPLWLTCTDKSLFANVRSRIPAKDKKENLTKKELPTTKARYRKLSSKTIHEHEDDISVSIGSSYDPIPDSSWHFFVSECLAEVGADVTGECSTWASGNNYGTMKNWNTSLVTKMVGYVWYDDYTADFIGFGSKSSFNGDISGWDTSQVTTMESMFMEASAFNQNIGEWDTSQVINMEQMFYRASAFNQDISGWTGTAATTSQVNIFFDATAFLLKFTCFETSAGPISSCTCNSDYCLTDDTFYNAIEQCLLEDEFNGLCTTYGLTTTKYGTMPDWDVSRVTKMVGIDDYTADFIGFGSKSSFNGDISGWDTSQVTTMESMFMEASAFNQNIGEWDTSQVINMEQMFYGASAFNQDISGWTGTAATTSQVNIFFDATAFLLKFTCFETSAGPISSCTCNSDYCLTDDTFYNAIEQCLLEDEFDGLCTTYGLTTTKYGTMPDWDVSRVTKMVGIR